MDTAEPCDHAGQEPGCCLIRRLRVDRAGDAEFTGRPGGGRAAPERTFGGGMIAQALLAAGATVPPGLAPGSLHAYFVSPGAAGQPMHYTVATLGQGRSSALRQVTAAQDGATRLVMLTSFRVLTSDGPGHQRTPPAAGAPPQLDAAEACRCESSDLTCGLALRPATAPDEPASAAGAQRATWIRARHALGDRPLWQAAVLSYLSDIATIRTVDQPHLGQPGRIRAASVDHALWFHRPPRADQWLWYWQRSPVYAGGRGMSEGELYDAAGRLVASSAQEVALRRTE
jgi:acyl-CoA thioesterase II